MAQTPDFSGAGSLAPNPEKLLTLCKASADALRLAILRVLSHDSYSVLELCRIFDIRQPAMSHHLKILATAQLVATQREGNTIFYRRANQAAEPALAELQLALLNAVDAMTLEAAQLGRIEALRRERSDRSRAFFTHHADEFRQQQEQIVPYAVYGPQAADLLRRSVRSHRAVLEVGPGEGAFLAELSALFEQVYALDNSATMLDKARSSAQAGNLSNIELIYGDTQLPDLKTMDLDAVVINMVLHHVPSPHQLFADIAALLATGGQLYVTDLCKHDQSWVQEACGDLWLGFDPVDLGNWAARAGFLEGESIYLTQRNGFRIQIREFVRQ